MVTFQEFLSGFPAFRVTFDTFGLALLEFSDWDFHQRRSEGHGCQALFLLSQFPLVKEV